MGQGTSVRIRIAAFRAIEASERQEDAVSVCLALYLEAVHAAVPDLPIMGNTGDFDEAMARGRMYQDFERHAYEETCNLFKEAK